MKKPNPKLDMFIEFFSQHGVKFIDTDTGEEIEPSNSPTTVCHVCDNETPEGKHCMWCQNKLEKK